MKLNVLNRFTSAVLFTAEIETDSDTTHSIKLGLAVKWAIKNSAKLVNANLIGAKLVDANLRDANLIGANLRDANLIDANLRDVNLIDANLRGANLIGANLVNAKLGDADLGGANLRGANLGYANLGYANLRGANLRGANLGYADLGDANLIDANLRDANLIDANLRGANLGDANLRGANLRGANLESIKWDFFGRLSIWPNEADALLKAIKNGEIDGSTYQGECACFVGTIANIKGCEYNDLNGLKPDSSSPTETLFAAIKKGDTPKNNNASEIVAEWVKTFIKHRDLARAS